MLDNHPLLKIVNVNMKSFKKMTYFTEYVLNDCLEVIQRENISSVMNDNGWKIIGSEFFDTPAMPDVSIDVKYKHIKFHIPDIFMDALTRNDIHFMVNHEFGHFLDVIDNKVGITSDDDMVFDGQLVDMQEYYQFQEHMNIYLMRDNMKEYKKEASKYHRIPIELSANTYAATHTINPPEDISLLLAYKIGLNNGKKNSKNLSLK